MLGLGVSTVFLPNISNDFRLVLKLLGNYLLLAQSEESEKALEAWK